MPTTSSSIIIPDHAKQDITTVKPATMSTPTTDPSRPGITLGDPKPISRTGITSINMADLATTPTILSARQAKRMTAIPFDRVTTEKALVDVEESGDLLEREPGIEPVPLAGVDLAKYEQALKELEAGDTEDVDDDDDD